ncbi:MAG: CHRD domain-containing protein [Cucumibacter sp.]
MNRLVSALLAAALALGLAGVGVAYAKTIALTAELSGLNEAPPNGVAATGLAEATFDTESMILDWTVTYEGLSGPAIGAHIHGPVEPGSNAGILIEFDPIEVSPITGSATLTQVQAADLLAGLYYVNLHTAAHPGGEVRGQLIAQ